MSRREQEKKSDGPGFFSTLLVAGGAAAVGFMAHKLMSDYQAEEQSGSGAACPASGSTSWDTEEAGTPTGKRKDNRSKVPDEDLPPEVRCIVCMTNPREIILIPCGHVCLCEDCAEKIPSKCPVCSQHIREKKVAFLP